MPINRLTDAELDMLIDDTWSIESVHVAGRIIKQMAAEIHYNRDLTRRQNMNAMTQTEKQIDYLARAIFEALYDCMTPAGREHFKDQRGPWRHENIMAAAQAALPHLLHDINLALVLSQIVNDPRLAAMREGE